MVDKVKELVELLRKNDMYKTLGQLLEKLGWRASDDRVQKPERGLRPWNGRGQ